MKKSLSFFVMLCAISIHCYPEKTISSRNTTTYHQTVQNEEWEDWVKGVRAEAYHKSTGERATDYNYGLDYVNCPVQRQVKSDGTVIFRIKAWGKWHYAEKSNKAGYDLMFKDGTYIYFFNLQPYVDPWEDWAKGVRAEAYHKSTGERATDYNYGLDYVNCPVQRQAKSDGTVIFRIKTWEKWHYAEKSNKAGYDFMFKDGTYIYYFNI